MEQFRASLTRGLTLIDVHSHPAADATALSRFTKEGKNLFGSAPFSRPKPVRCCFQGKTGLGMRVARSAALFFVDRKRMLEPDRQGFYSALTIGRLVTNAA